MNKDELMKRAIKENLKTTKQIVEYLMGEEPRCRNDDTWLQFRFLEFKGMNITIDGDEINWKIKLTEFGKIPKFETVRRVRAEIQNRDGNLLPTDARTLIHRQIKESAIREY